MIIYKKILLLGFIAAGSLQAIGQKITASFTPDGSNQNFSGKVFYTSPKTLKTRKMRWLGFISSLVFLLL